MPKFVETPDGRIHQLPDSVTDENYLEEKEKFLTNYNIPQPQEDFTSQPQPQPQPQPEISTDLPSSALIGASLLNRVEENEGKFFGRRDYTEEDKDRSGLGLQIRGSFSKLLNEQDATYNRFEILKQIAELRNERNKILSKVSLTTEDKDRLNEIDSIIKGKEFDSEEERLKAEALYSIGVDTGDIQPYEDLEGFQDNMYKNIGIDKASINIGILSSLIGFTSLDLLTVEGLSLNYANDDYSKDSSKHN